MCPVDRIARARDGAHSPMARRALHRPQITRRRAANLSPGWTQWRLGAREAAHLGAMSIAAPGGWQHVNGQALIRTDRALPATYSVGG
jgi:hypothetical protein